VLSTGLDTTLAWTFRRSAVLSDARGPFAVARATPSDVAVDDRDVVYVLDRERRSAAVFGTDGLLTGRLGAGPPGRGALEVPVALSVSPSGVLSVLDAAKRALVRYDSLGQFIGDAALPQRFLAGRFGAIQSGVVGMLGEREPDREWWPEQLVIVTDTGVRELTARLADSKTVEFAECGATLRAAVLFSHAPVWDVSGDLVAYSLDPRYVVHVFREGRLTRSVRRAFASVPVTEAMALGVIVLPDAACEPDPRQLVLALGFAPVHPAVHDIRLVPNGWMWIVRRDANAAGARIDVFNDSGVYEGTLPAGTPVPVRFTSSGHAIVAEWDSSGADRLVLYEIGRD
jgi:hypothetical protein